MARRSYCGCLFSLVCLRERKTRAHHRVLLHAKTILDVGRRDECAIGQQFEARIAAIATFVAVQQLDFVFAVLAADDVLVVPDPRDEMILRGAVASCVAKAHHQPTVLRIHRLVAISVQTRRQRLHLRPRFPFVIARDEVRGLRADVLTHQAEQLFAIGRAHHLRLAGLQIAEIHEHAPGTPSQAAIR